MQLMRVKHLLQNVENYYAHVASISLPGWSLQIIFVSCCLVLDIGQEITKMCKGYVSLDS